MIKSPVTLEYPDYSIYEVLRRSAELHPALPAYEFLGTKVSYKDFLREVQVCAKGMKALGIKEGDSVTICLPNIPQAIIMFYALSHMGAIANMIHPLSPEVEIEFYLRESSSVAAITLDAFYEKFQEPMANAGVKTLIIASIKDKLTGLKKTGYQLTKGRKIKEVPQEENVVFWKDLMAQGKIITNDPVLENYSVEKKGDDPAVILYSGGTTGKTKGILLSNLNFNALAMQTSHMGDCLYPGVSMLSIMPVFHGFGLGIGIHTIILNAGCCILIPTFSADGFAMLLKKHRPNLIAGVPTLFEALLRSKTPRGYKLDHLEGVFSGGDTLSIELKKKVDEYLRENGASVEVREGYGMTESVTASCLAPKDFNKPGSVGKPFPDMSYKIVKSFTQKEVFDGKEGEICVSGPTLMMGYLGDPKETAHTLQRHGDGLVWLHTGDIGYIDEDGFVFFKQRLKRMIVSSGYSIYPSQIENIIDAHPDVLMSTVIGVDDPYKKQKVKAFIVLKPEVHISDQVKKSVKEYCEKNIARYAMPYEFEYRESLPKTLVGKVAYTVLEEEERKAQAENL